MRTVLREAIEGARDEMLRFTQEAAMDRTLSDEEMLQRYTTKHRGNVDALIAFARRHAPPGSNPVTEAVRYEQRMERLIRARGG